MTTDAISMCNISKQPGEGKETWSSKKICAQVGKRAARKGTLATALGATSRAFSVKDTAGGAGLGGETEDRRRQ